MQSVHRWWKLSSQSPLYCKNCCLNVMLWSHWAATWYFGVFLFSMASVQPWPVWWIKTTTPRIEASDSLAVAFALKSPLMSGAGCYLQTNGDFSSPPIHHFWVCSENNREKKSFLEKILPFTNGYIIPKLDYFANTFSRASQYEMSY